MPEYELAQRPDSPNWYIVWTEGRRSKRYSTGTPDRDQAELVLAAYRLEQHNGPQAKPAEIGIGAVLEEYRLGHAEHLPSAEQAKIAIKHLTAHWGIATVDRLTLRSQDEYIIKRKAAGIGAETINRELSVLRAALNRAVKYGRLLAAPHIKSLPKPAARERFLTRPEAARLLKACDDLHLRTFVRLALYTAARSGAILELTWDRVDFERGLIWFPLPERTPTNKRRAVVPFEGALARALRWLKKHSKGKHVVNYRGEGVAAIKKAFASACARAKLKGVTPHTLRHTAATWAAQNGVDLWDIAGMLGHSKMSMTERYAKHRPDHLRTAIRAVLRAKRAPKKD